MGTLEFSLKAIEDAQQNDKEDALDVLTDLSVGRFSNYLFTINCKNTPHHHALSRLFTETLLRYVTLSTPPPLPNKKRNFRI